MQRHALLIGINRYPKVPNADLRGCLNDVALVRAVLTERFAFPAAQIRVLTDEAATRDGICAAMDELTARVEKDDVVAFFYAGHGSRRRDPRAPERLVDSLVPHDSGRGTAPNRDILDVEIDRWVQELNRKTPYVTLIIDCCHSGDITRDVFGEAVRELPADLRPVEPSSAATVTATLTTTVNGTVSTTRSLGAETGRAGWVLGRRRAVVIAACRAEELANEHAYFDGRRMVRDGAMTFFLSRALSGPEASRDGVTWRDVFERLAPLITAEYPRQHPQIEGKMDELLFGTTESRPAPYLEISRVGVGIDGDGDGVELSGGGAHGVTPGSLFTVRPHGAHHRGAGSEIARLEVVEAGSARARARIVEAAAELETGQRAFLLRHEVPLPALRVRAAAPPPRRAAIEGLLDSADLLTRVDDEAVADVLVRGLEPRPAAAPGDPCPGLGALEEPLWAALGRDGRLVARPRPDTPDGLADLARDLALVGRYRRLLALDNPDPASRLRREARLRVRRFDPAAGSLVDAGPEAGSGLVIFRSGEKADFVVENAGEETLYLTLVQFGVDFSIQLMMPHPGHSIYKKESLELAAGATLSVRDYFWRDERYHRLVEQGLPLHLPKNFPWAAEPGEESPLGILSLKLFLTREPTHFEFLEQGATRPARPPTHPLARLALLHASGKGTRDFIPEPVEEEPQKDWATLTLAVGIRS